MISPGFTGAMQWIVLEEGGYSKDPKDPGGETKFGVSKRSYPSLDISQLTIGAAAELYRRDYWDRANCDSLPAPWALALFDAAVMHGIRPAVQMLQKSVGVAPDGVVGPHTIAAVRSVSGLDSTFTSFLADRGVYMARAAASPDFLRGWLRRIFRLGLVCSRLAGA